MASRVAFLCAALAVWPLVFGQAACSSGTAAAGRCEGALDEEDVGFLQVHTAFVAPRDSPELPRGFGSRCYSSLSCLGIKHSKCVNGTCVCKEGYQEAPQRGCVKKSPLLMWCTSGGGLRATSAAQGYANSFARAGLFRRRDLAAIGANSGGTWWLSQFAFDEEYFHGNGQSDRMQFEAWLQDLWNYTVGAIGPAPDPTNEQSLGPQGRLLLYMYQVAMGLGFHPQVFRLFVNPVASYSFGYSWRRLIRVLFRDGGVAKTSAQLENRPVLRRPSLHFSLSGLVNHFTQTDSPLPQVAWGLTSEQSAVAFEGERNCGFIPMQYVVPGTFRTCRSARLAAKLRTPPNSAVDWSERLQGLSKSFTLNPFGLTNTSFEQVTASSDIGSVTLEQVASMSSAQGAITSPMLALQELFYFSGDDASKLNAFLNHEVTPLGGVKIGEFFKGSLPLALMNFNRLAACEAPENDDDDCRFPSQTYTDSGLFDNMGVAQTMADLQQRYGTHSTLRVVLTDQSDPAEFGKWNLELYFGSVGAPPPGSFARSSFSGAVIPVVQVFAAQISEIVWRPLQTTLGTGSVEYATLRTVTVENPAFGVRGGQHVELLMFFASTKAPAFFGSVTDYVGAALSTSDQLVSTTLQTWLDSFK